MKEFLERIKNFFAQYPFITLFIVVAGLVYVSVIVARAFGVQLRIPETVRAFFAVHHVYIILTVVFGALVGASEIASRYRDEPFLAIVSLPGRVYLTFNGLVSAAAYYLLIHYKDKIFPGLGDDLLLASMVAGFGSMVIMRSKLFNFKTENGESYSVGPDAVVSTLLSTVDRNIDRYRSFDRQALVYKETTRIGKPSEAPVFLRTFLASYQNLSEKEKTELNKTIDDILKRTDLDDNLKLMAISFGFLNISGDANFKALMELLDQFQKATKPTPTGTP
ncbi:MAG TPA: hypothetical protein VGJ55_14585 [Pyrinomonadaceae bacterium]|jgi:hypothetical protein